MKSLFLVVFSFLSLYNMLSSPSNSKASLPLCLLIVIISLSSWFFCLVTTCSLFLQKLLLQNMWREVGEAEPEPTVEQNVWPSPARGRVSVCSWPCLDFFQFVVRAVVSSFSSCDKRARARVPSPPCVGVFMQSSEGQAEKCRR